MKRLLLFIAIGFLSLYSSQAQVPSNDLIENALLVSSFPTSDLNVQFGNATNDPAGEMGCAVSQNYNTIFYKFTVDFTRTVNIQVADSDGGTIPANSSFVIVYSAPTLNATSPSELSLVSSCLFGTVTDIQATVGINYYVVVFRDISSGSNTNITFDSVINDVPISERNALIAFYNATGGDNWTNNTNWLTNTPVSSWYGVFTGTVNGQEHVTEFRPNNNNLNGTIPSEITDLTELRNLWIQGNYLTGEIPSNIGDLTNLVQFVLNNNFGMTGSIPASFNNCSNLEYLLVQGHQFNGAIPDFTSLSNLTFLWIGYNNFEFGDFETEFPAYQANLGINFTYSNMGLIDTEYVEAISTGNSTTLISNLSGSQNNYQWYKDDILLTGETNPNLNITINSAADYGVYYYTSTSNIVVGLTLTSRNFTLSDVPSSNLDYDALVALYNSTNGNNWTNNTNWLDDTKPLNTWHGITVENNRVTRLYLGSNNLVGPLPIEIGNFDELTELGLWANQLNGTIPSEIGNLSNLTLLDLAPNTFTGNIPPEIGNLTNLETLWLNQNGLTGTIPSTFQNLINLKYLYLIGSAGPPYSSSAFSGDIPDLTGLPLETFQMQRNYFTFSDIADEFATYQANIPQFEFSPQYTLDTTEDIDSNVGDDIVLSLTDVPSTNKVNFGKRRLEPNSYQWFKDGMLIPGADQNTHTLINAQPSDSGIYHCEITNADVPGMIILRENINVNVGTLSSEDVQFLNARIYPNPVQNELTIILNNTTSGMVQLFDIRGREILSKHINSNISKLSMINLQSGVYIIKLSSDDGHSITKRIIKK